MLELKGTISIGRTQVSNGDDYIHIEIQDDGASRARVIKARMGLEDFAKDVTGLGYVPCKVSFNDSGIVGKKAEHKEELLPRMGDNVSHEDIENKKAHVAPWEVDGWRARLDNLTNMHRVSGEDKIRVSFTRFVDDDGNPVEIHDNR